MDWMTVIEEIAAEMRRRADRDSIDGHVTMNRNRLYAWAEDLEDVLKVVREE